MPGKRDLLLRYLLLDLNGTLTLDGAVLPGVRERLHQLSGVLEIFIVTCDTHGNGARIAQELRVGLKRTSQPGPGEAAEKAEIARSFGAEQVVAIGNGDSDLLMLKECGLSIAVLGTEGLSVKALLNADLVVKDICDAFDLLLHEKRLIATLRGSP
ncbi:MAG TPA: ATPase P [Propionibacteriaceae bacterium]|nr:ATPase P [Propionibacteriaceae bacterium]